MFPILIILSAIMRLITKPIDVGIGPEPLINNVYHAKAMKARGWTCETVVDSVFFITDDFNIRLDFDNFWLRYLSRAFCLTYLYTASRYKILYIYFNGGGLYATTFLWRFEPWLYRIAGVKIVCMPYGGDVQDMQKCHNLNFRFAVDSDYPRHYRRSHVISKKVDLWCSEADHVIAGCDWVDYITHCDTLCLAHFSIDLNDWKFIGVDENLQRPLRILHAPNHTNIKGTSWFVDAVKVLQSEGIEIELIMAQGVSNRELKKLIEKADIVADQLVIGWYAMFALEGMASGKPVICNIRDDLESLYIFNGLIKPNELPLIRADYKSIVPVLRKLVLTSRKELGDIGAAGRQYAERHHSIETIGKMFDSINLSLLSD